MSKRNAWIGTAFFLAMVVLRVLYLRRGEIIVDEFQHLHAAYLVAAGQTPYVDFFEHHTPLFYYLVAPLLRASALDFDTILSMRHLSFGAGLLTILIASWWARRLRGAAAGVLVGALMLGDFFLFSRGTILFLDVFACPFLMLSAIFLSESRGRFRAAFASGLAMGVAILFTQKAVMAGFAVLFIFAARWFRRGDAGGKRGQSPFVRSTLRAVPAKGDCPLFPRGDDGGRRWLSEVGGFVAGGVVAALSLPAMLGFGGLGDFFQDNVIMNMAWKARHFPVRELAALAGTNAAVYLLALVGLAVRSRGLWQRRFRVLPEDVPALFLASLALGIVLLPVVWSEYFVLVVHFAVLVAGLLLSDLACVRTRRWVVVLAAACAAVSIVDLFGRWLVRDHPLSTPALGVVLALWGLIGGSLALLLRARRPVWTLWAAALLLAFPVVEQVDFLWQQPNDAQRARVEFVLTNTGPDDPVFDGYSGYGVFRPHAYRYWFLHEEVQAMLSGDELRRGVIDAIEQSRAPIAVRDQWSGQLPDEVLRYLSEKYAPTEFPDILIRKRQ
jgi:hypothetical protein